MRCKNKHLQLTPENVRRLPAIIGLCRAAVTLLNGDACQVTQAQSIRVAAGRLGWSEDERTQLAAELVEGLNAMGRLRDAAVVSLEHLNSPDAAVQLFCSAHEWCQVCDSSAPLLLPRWPCAYATCLDT